MVSLSKLGYFTAKMSCGSSELKSGERAGEVVGKAVANQHEPFSCKTFEDAAEAHSSGGYFAFFFPAGI